MAQIILDMGSGNTCKNDVGEVEKMIDAIAGRDIGAHNIVLKWQLFNSAPPNVPLDREIFRAAYEIAKAKGLKTTASVFDADSMRFLMGFDVPFVKIACRPELYALAELTSKPVYISTAQTGMRLLGKTVIQLACVPKYPATIEDYEKEFTKAELLYISDHTVGWRLYNKYRPQIIEKHFVHVREPGNPDAGPFAVTPKEITWLW
jgi:sialic acid synthase SpsE